MKKEIRVKNKNFLISVKLLIFFLCSVVGFMGGLSPNPFLENSIFVKAVENSAYYYDEQGEYRASYYYSSYDGGWYFSRFEDADGNSLSYQERNREKIEITSYNILSEIEGEPVVKADISGYDDLETLTFPNEIKNISVFGCNSLKSLAIPENVESFKVNMCNGLESITFLENVKKVDILDCKALKSIELSKGLEDIRISNAEMIESIKLPEGVTGIHFFGCTSLKSIKIPKSVTTIGFRAFYNCASLKSIKIPETVTSIGESAFQWCTSLKSVEFSEGLEEVGDGAFSKCPELKSVVIPKSVTKIGKSAFGYTNYVSFAQKATSGLLRVLYTDEDFYMKPDTSPLEEGYVIYGKKGSIAQKYADENGIQFRVGSVRSPASGGFTIVIVLGFLVAVFLGLKRKGILQNIWNMSRNLLITVKEKFLQGKPKIFHDNTTEKHTKTVSFRQFVTTWKEKIPQKIPKSTDTSLFEKQPQSPTFTESLPIPPKEEHPLNIPENVNTNISDIQPQTFPNVRNQDNSNTLETKNIAVSQSKDFILYAIIILLCLILVVMTAFGIWYFRKFQPNMPAVVLENQETTENVVMELPIQTETVITPTESPILETEMIVETIAPSEIIPVGDISPQYVFVGGKYTWEEAETNCESYGGHLATIHSDKQWDALINAVTEAKKNNPELRYIWMGATSEVDNNMNLSLSWVDNEESNYIMKNTSCWYYNQKLGIHKPSGYDAYEYQSSGNLVREPYLLLWMADDAEDWTLNDVPDVTNYTNYKNSNMGYIMQLPPDAEIPQLETQAPTVAIVLPKRSDPSISGEIKLTHGTSEMGDTNIYTLYVSGNYDSYWIDCDYYGYNGNGKLFSKNETSSSLKLEESTEVYKVIAYITPYYNDGTKGNMITCNYEIKWEEPDVAVHPCYGVGEISSTGVAGFTTSYVVEHGAKKTVRNELGNR